MSDINKLERIKQAYYSGLKVQIWFNGHWENFDARDYSMYSDPFSENRQYRIVGSTYADIAEKCIAELKKENAELKAKLKPENCLKLLAKEGYIKSSSEQLTKAKEYIRTLISCLINWVQEGDKDYCYITDAEQFLKEIKEND